MSEQFSNGTINPKQTLKHSNDALIERSIKIVYSVIPVAEILVLGRYPISNAAKVLFSLNSSLFQGIDHTN